jgi:hypothetical protein
MLDLEDYFARAFILSDADDRSQLGEEFNLNGDDVGGMGDFDEGITAPGGMNDDPPIPVSTSPFFFYKDSDSLEQEDAPQPDLNVPLAASQWSEFQASTLNSRREVFPGAAKSFGAGSTLLDHFADDKYATERQQNLYHPFASKDEWELAVALDRLGVSKKKLDHVLRTKLASPGVTRFHAES